METLGLTAGAVMMLLMLVLLVLGILLPYFVYRIAGDVREMRATLVEEARAQTAILRRWEREGFGVRG